MLEINENQGFKFLWQLRLDSLNPWGTGGFSESLSTVNCQLSTINYQLSTINCLMPPNRDRDCYYCADDGIDNIDKFIAQPINIRL